MGSIITAILVFSFLIFVHELGHFLAAKKTGVGVQKFSIGFGPRLFGVTRGGTEYVVSAIPFGGFVKMVGDDPEEEVEDEERSFLLKPVWMRTLIVFAGPASNMLSAVAIIYVVCLVGIPTMLTTVGTVKDDYPAAAAGVLPGDTITAVDGKPVQTWDELTAIVHNSAGISMEFILRRGDEEKRFAITPQASTSKNVFGEDVSIGLVGITPADEFMTVRYGPVASLGRSVGWTWGMIRLTLAGIVKMFQGVVSTEELGGPIMIMQVAGKSAEQGLLNTLYFTAYISIALGLFNLFPIPILDGGHLLFFLVEAVRGRPLSLRKREVMQQIGLVILVCLMLFATKNDLFRIFGW